MANFKLKELPYEYNALEPFISKETLEFHHDKHHQAYTNNFNAALDAAEITSENFEEIFSNVADKPAIRNNGGGYWNHTFYWESMGLKDSMPNEKLGQAIEDSFGSFEKFQEEFTKMATTNFGSGWTWLASREDGSLVIYNTANQDNYMMDVCENKEKPILVIDIWEHAYYIDYRNKRPEYIEKFLNIINWNKVSERYSEIIKN